jgi:fatty acid-binding protein DegV
MAIEKIGDRRPLYLNVIHANCEEKAKKVLEQISAEIEPVESFITWMSPVIGVHTGPGTVGVVIMAGIE